MQSQAHGQYFQRWFYAEDAQKVRLGFFLDNGNIGGKEEPSQTTAQLFTWLSHGRTRTHTRPPTHIRDVSLSSMPITKLNPGEMLNPGKNNSEGDEMRLERKQKKNIYT